MILLYKKAFGLEIDWQGKDEKTNRIYHTEARIGNQRIRLSDGGPEAIQAKEYGHRRTVHRSVGDRKQLLAGRLSDKMSSELGYYRNVVAELCFFI